MNNYFQNKVVLITGSSRGLGFTMAKELLKLKAKVIITARSIERLTVSEKMLKELGEVYAIPCDISDYEDSKNLIEKTITKFKKIDIIINNAGISMRGQFENLSKEVMDQMVQTNLLGQMYITNLSLPHLKKTNGQIIFISSIAGLLGLPNASAYCAAKFALKGLTESIRIEVSHYDIHVGIVYLGFTEHDHEKKLIGEKGELLLATRPVHHTQLQATQKILKMIKNKKNEIALTGLGKISYLISRVCPSAIEKIIKIARKNKWKLYQRLS